MQIHFIILFCAFLSSVAICTLIVWSNNHDLLSVYIFVLIVQVFILILHAIYACNIFQSSKLYCVLSNISIVSNGLALCMTICSIVIFMLNMNVLFSTIADLVFSSIIIFLHLYFLIYTPFETFKDDVPTKIES